MNLAGKKVSLRSYQAQDKEKITGWFGEDRYDAFFVFFKEHDLQPASSDDFEKEFSAFGIKLWMVEELKSKMVVGAIIFSPLVKKAGVFQLALFIDQKCQRNKLALEAFVLTAHELFASHGCRKLVCLSPAADSYLNNIKTKAGFTCEAVLKRHDFVRGQYIDLERSAIFREDFFKKYQDVLASFPS